MPILFQILFLGVCIFGMFLAAEYLWKEFRMDHPVGRKTDPSVEASVDPEL